MKSLIVLAILFIFLLLPSVNAVYIGKNTIFRTSGSSCDYHMANNFTVTNGTVYSTALNFNGANISTYPSSGWINMSIEKMESTVIKFTNNVTAANITIENGFANFSVIDNYAYIICYQSNDTKYQSKVATEGSVQFIDIPNGSWYIMVDTILPTPTPLPTPTSTPSLSPKPTPTFSPTPTPTPTPTPSMPTSSTLITPTPTSEPQMNITIIINFFKQISESKPTWIIVIVAILTLLFGPGVIPKIMEILKKKRKGKK